MERVIDCPICFDTDSCFEDVQDEFKSYMCFNCGFMSSTYYTKDSEHKIQSSSQLIQDLRYWDKEREIYWYPSVVNMGKLGIIYPEGTKDNWNWKFARVRELTEEEKKDPKYGGHEHTLDMDNADEYGQHEFLQACKDMGIIKNI